MALRERERCLARFRARITHASAECAVLAGNVGGVVAEVQAMEEPVQGEAMALQGQLARIQAAHSAPHAWKCFDLACVVLAVLVQQAEVMALQGQLRARNQPHKSSMPRCALIKIKRHWLSLFCRERSNPCKGSCEPEVQLHGEVMALRGQLRAKERMIHEMELAGGVMRSRLGMEACCEGVGRESKQACSMSSPSSHPFLHVYPRPAGERGMPRATIPLGALHASERILSPHKGPLGSLSFILSFMCTPGLRASVACPALLYL
eukprot:1155788-Pelagomonas_calceolata.AAC.2